MEDLLNDWVRIPDTIQNAIAGLSGAELDRRGGSNDWSIRETVHHLVEANLVASTIILATLGSGGCTYDWSWLNPDREWMLRTRYSTAPVEPALGMLKSLCRYIADLLTMEARVREVRLLDAPGAAVRALTIEDVLRDELVHAQEHLREVAASRSR